MHHAFNVDPFLLLFIQTTFLLYLIAKYVYYILSYFVQSYFLAYFVPGMMIGLDLASHFLWKDTWFVSICKCILKYVLRICARLTLHSFNFFAGPSLWGLWRNMSFRKRRHRVVRGQRPAPRRGWATRSGCRRSMDGICTGWSPQILRSIDSALLWWTLESNAETLMFQFIELFNPDSMCIN